MLSEINLLNKKNTIWLILIKKLKVSLMFLMFLLTMKIVVKTNKSIIWWYRLTGVNGMVNKEHAWEINLMKRGK